MSQDVSQDVYLTLTTDLTALIDELGQLQLGCLVRKQGDLARRVTPMLARAEACLGALRAIETPTGGDARHQVTG